jgi:uncharacterized protein (DUF2344 family)
LKIEQDVQNAGRKIQSTGTCQIFIPQESFRAVGRTLLRSGLNLIYSQGYNPHLKMSLPLPKSVGLASEDELFYVQIAAEDVCEKEIYKNITANLPNGFSRCSMWRFTTAERVSGLWMSSTKCR